jgi:hypothetical protein
VKDYIYYWYSKKGINSLNAAFIAVSQYVTSTSWRFPDGVTEMEVCNMDTMEAVSFYLPFALREYQAVDPIFDVAVFFQSWITRSLTDNLTEEQLEENSNLIFG